jgi:hypothetical protein
VPPQPIQDHSKLCAGRAPSIVRKSTLTSEDSPMFFLLSIISDFIEVPLLILLDLLFFSAWISLVLIIPDRILARCVWGLLKVLLFVLSVPYCAARWLFVLPRPIDSQSHSLFCRCQGCRAPEEEMEQLLRSAKKPER